MAAKIIAVLVIILGIGISLWLIRNPQVFQPKATESVDISFQTAYNPFGDPWASNIGTNPDIPVTLTSGCYRRGPKWDGRTTDPAVSDEEINHLAKSNTGLVFEECGMLQGPSSSMNRQRLINLATKLKQKNPNAKYIGYHVFWRIDFDPQFATDIYTKAESDGMCGTAKCESFFIHKKDLPATKANRIPGHYMDITNPAYRQYIAPKVAQTLNEMNMDGFLADGVAPTIPGTDNTLIPDVIRNNWSAAWPDLFRDVKAAIGPNKLLFVNSGGVGVDFSRPMITNDGASPRADGLMWEDPLGPVGQNLSATGRLGEINRMLDMVSGLNKHLLIVVNTNVNCGNSSGQPTSYCFSQTNKSREMNFQKYYLSLYLNLFRNNKTTLVYYHPLATSPQFDSEAFFRDWNLKIGQPTTGMQEVSGGVYLRKFQNAWVYWNNSSGGYTTAGVGLFNLNGTQATQHSIPANSGAIYVSQSVLTDWNQPPPSPIAVSPSPVAIPSPLNCITKPVLSKPAVMGATGLTVNLTAGTNAEVPANQLYQIKFTGFANGTVTIGNTTYTQPFDYAVPVGTTTVSFLIKQVTYGQATQITLKAVDKCGENDQFFGGGTGSGWPNPNPSPSPVISPSPSPLTVKPNIFPDQSSSYCIGNASRNHLQWVTVPGAVIYKVFRGTTAVGSGIKVGETSGIAINDDNAAPGVRYTYGVEANNAAGAAINGDPFDLTTLTCPVTVSPSPAVSPSVSPSPSSIRKVGDIDNNGRVDIFDFNFLVADYRGSNIRSDLNGDGKVDLFDFNLLITNFGK